MSHHKRSNTVGEMIMQSRTSARNQESTSHIDNDPGIEEYFVFLQTAAGSLTSEAASIFSPIVSHTTEKASTVANILNHGAELKSHIANKYGPNAFYVGENGFSIHEAEGRHTIAFRLSRRAKIFDDTKGAGNYFFIREQGFDAIMYEGSYFNGDPSKKRVKYNLAIVKNPQYLKPIGVYPLPPNHKRCSLIKMTSDPLRATPSTLSRLSHKKNALISFENGLFFARKGFPAEEFVQNSSNETTFKQLQSMFTDPYRLATRQERRLIYPFVSNEIGASAISMPTIRGIQLLGAAGTAYSLYHAGHEIIHSKQPLVETVHQAALLIAALRGGAQGAANAILPCARLGAAYPSIAHYTVPSCVAGGALLGGFTAATATEITWHALGDLLNNVIAHPNTPNAANIKYESPIDAVINFSKFANYFSDINQPQQAAYFKKQATAAKPEAIASFTEEKLKLERAIEVIELKTTLYWVRKTIQLFADESPVTPIEDETEKKLELERAVELTELEETLQLTNEVIQLLTGESPVVPDAGVEKRQNKNPLIGLKDTLPLFIKNYEERAKIENDKSVLIPVAAKSITPIAPQPSATTVPTKTVKMPAKSEIDWDRIRKETRDREEAQRRHAEDQRRQQEEFKRRQDEQLKRNTSFFEESRRRTEQHRQEARVSADLFIRQASRSTAFSASSSGAGMFNHRSNIGGTLSNGCPASHPFRSANGVCNNIDIRYGGK